MNKDKIPRMHCIRTYQMRDKNQNPLNVRAFSLSDERYPKDETSCEGGGTMKTVRNGSIIGFWILVTVYEEVKFVPFHFGKDMRG